MSQLGLGPADVWICGTFSHGGLPVGSERPRLDRPTGSPEVATLDPVTDPFMREHPELVSAANDVLADLRGFRGRLVRDQVAHFQHDEFGERAHSLERYLSSAVLLCAREEYLPAFAVLRAALEHHLTDRLLFLGRRYKRVYTGVKKRDYEKLRAQCDAKEPGTEDIARLEWRGGVLTVVRTGLHTSDGAKGPRAPTISIYYFLLDEFDPFVGHPREQAHLARGFTSVEQRIELAQEQQAMYRALRWDEIKSNLRENGLCGVETLRQFEVHYRFLSAFVHPMLAAYNLVYGHNRPSNAPSYDHYSSELALLYINKIAAQELKALKRMASRPPRVTLYAWETVEAHVAASDKAAAHLWFPGDQPDTFDYVEEANSRGLRNGQPVPAHRRPTPDDLSARQVRYYRNPLTRLIRMHQSFQELTGFGYVSPWPREDARFR